MLKLKYLYENFELAKECLQCYDYDEENLDEMMNYFRISSNAIYPFIGNKDKNKRVCFLRFAPVEEKKYEDVESEIRLIQWLIGQGFPAMKPYPMKDGSLLKQLDTQWGTVIVSCFEKVSGQTLEDVDGNLEIAYGYGKTLGLMHKTLMNYPDGSSRVDHVEFLDEILARLEKYHAPKKIVDECHNVSEELNKLTLDRDCYGVVHYDFEPDNVMYSSKLDEFGVIDFDDSIRCWYALDITRAIDAMDDVVDEDMVDEAIEKFFEGYRSEKPISEEQMKSIPLMRRLVNVQSYATLLHVLSEEVSDSPEWMDELKDKLYSEIDRIEATIK